MAASSVSLVCWCLLVVVLQGHHSRADFGLPTVVMGGSVIITNANGINTALNLLDRTFRRLNTVGQSEQLVQAGEVMTHVTQNVTVLGRLLANSVIKAVGDRSTPTDELFAKLQQNFGQLSGYLSSDVPNAMETLNSSIGNVHTEELKKALDLVSDAVAGVTSVTTEVGTAVARIYETASGKQITKAVISANIPPNLTVSLSKALINTKDQLTMLSRTIEDMLKSISQANAFLGKFNSARQASEDKLGSNQQGISSFIQCERDVALKRYNVARNAIISDISGAVGKLEVFTSNRTLLTLFDQHSEEYTKIYYYLYNRNESDIQNISNTYDTINTNLEQLLLGTTNNFASQTQQTVARLSEMYLARSLNWEFCYNKFSTQVVNTYPSYQNGITTCMNREKPRLSRITEVMDKVLQLVTSNSQDLAANIVSCTALSGFDKSEYVFRQAEACLSTNLIEMAKFQSIIGLEFDMMDRLGEAEIAASQYRVNDCVASRNNEAMANIFVMNKDIESCAVEKNLRTNFPQEPDSLGTEDPLEVATDVPEYDEHLIDALMN